MPMIGARFYTQLDSAYLWGDMIEGELEKVMLSDFMLEITRFLGGRKWTSFPADVQAWIS